MKISGYLLGLVAASLSALPAFAQNPIHVTYLWHMHQPVYYPYESVNATDSAGRFNFSVKGVHDQRLGPYGEWPKNAVQQAADKSIPNGGVQVSFSGSLMENMNGLYGFGWREHYRWARNGLRTVRNNPRLDAVGIAYHHSLMPLTTKESMRMQIRLHKEAYYDNWNSNGTYSKGFWPPECAFDVNMIPALVAEGLEWVIIDNGHFDRATQNYPWAPASSIRPNQADQLNPDPATIGSQWVQLNNVWAPTKVSAPWGYQPHRVQYIEPDSHPTNPVVRRIVAVPAARYEGNENGRGGYGAFKPENVWSTHANNGINNNSSRPMIILCHSDGDNFGMLNADAYNGQHGMFLEMTKSNPTFEHTSVQDYLELYPVPQNDVIHVEPGSWVGIDGGTPYFDKWRENNARSGEHPDLWSWSVLVAAANRVIHADNLENNYSMNDVRWGIGSDTAKAWRYYLQAETSCHWYWDFDRANPWDGNATRGANLAIAEANKVINRNLATDRIGPTIWPPQRDIYNPGNKHYNEATNQPSDFTVFTFVDDVNGLQSVTLKWRADLDGANPILEYDNELYARNASKVGAWTDVTMAGDFYPPVKGPLVPDPANRAKRYQAMITNQNNVLIDYYVEAVDGRGNTNRSDIAHVWVGAANGGGGGTPANPASVTFSADPRDCAPITVTLNATTNALAQATTVSLIYRFSTNESDWASTAINRLSSNTFNFTFSTSMIPDNAPLLEVAFNENGSNWVSNGGANWKAAIRDCAAPTGSVWTIPATPVAGQAVTIYYNPSGRPLAASPAVNIHYGFNNSNWTVAPGLPMTKSGAYWNYTYTLSPYASNIVLAFNQQGPDTWDNNSFGNWILPVTGAIAPPSGFVVTNVAPGLVVDANTTNFNLRGLGENISGFIRWSNQLTGASGVIPAINPWVIPDIALGTGTNLITLAASNTIFSTITNAQDSGSSTIYNDGWAEADNGGAGFGVWQIYQSSTDSGQNGRFMASGADVSIGTPAWGLYANSANLSEAKRNLSFALTTNHTFSVNFENGDLDNGAGAGVALQNSSGNTLWEFYFNGGNTNYSMSGGITDIGWQNSGINIEFQLTTPSNYLVKISPQGSFTRTLAGNLEANANQAITLFRAWNNNAGAGSNKDVFFNNLKITGRVENQGPTTNTTILIVRSLTSGGDTNSDGIPDAWFNKYPGLSATNAANTFVPGRNDVTFRDTYIHDVNPTNLPSGFNRANIATNAPVSNVTVLEINPSSTARLYNVFWVTDLMGDWTNTIGNFIPGTGGGLSFSVTNSTELRYYRTGVKLPE